jgi:16S rRNA (cytidine1402-2'-O)-methyltransferase
VVPGPSAVTAAVAGSGMVDGPFVFEGFLARRGGDRARRLEALSGERRPTILFLSPHRAAADLADIARACGPGRQVCVGREITKLHEEWWWGGADEAARRWSEEPARGEFTLVVAGADEDPPDAGLALDLARSYLEGGHTPSGAARRAARETGAERRVIYDALVGKGGVESDQS